MHHLTLYLKNRFLSFKRMVTPGFSCGYSQKLWPSNRGPYPLALLYQRFLGGQRWARRPRSQDTRICNLMSVVRLWSKNMAAPFSCWQNMIAVTVLLTGFLLGPAVMATAAGQPWADRPPSLDPSYGLPRPMDWSHSTVVPDWIWTAQTLNNQIIYLRHSFRLKTVPRQAELYATADNHLEVFLNGKEITSTFHKHNQVWRRARKIAVEAWLHPGDNTIAIRAKNNAAWAGVLVWITSGTRTLCRSDKDWHVAYKVPAGKAWIQPRFDDANWSQANVIAPYGSGPWAKRVSPWPAVHCGYLARLYFQPQRVTVLHGRADFKGLSSIPAALTPADIGTIRPEYQGRSLLAPAHRIDLVETPVKSGIQPELLISFRQEVAGRLDVRGTVGSLAAHPAAPVVLNAVYGILTDKARTRNVTALVRRFVKVGQDIFPVNRITALAGDPAPNIVKTLRVTFQWDGKTLVRTAQDGQEFNFPLAQGVVIGTGESKGEALNSPWGGWHPVSLNGKIQHTPWSAFRYAVIRFVGPVHLNVLRLDFKYYPVTYRGAFACSDPLLTKIWYTGAYTAHLCMQEQIWDAPKRDRAMWMGDLQVSGQVINNVFLDRFLMELTMRDLREEAQGGRPVTELPISYINNTPFGGIPGYSDAWYCGLADFYQHTGAIKYIRSQHQLLLSMLRYIKQGFNRKNIFVNKNKGWCFVDWANYLGFGNDPQSLVATDLYTCWAVRQAVLLLNAIGDKTDAAKYARWDRQITMAARKYLANPKTHTFTSLRQVNAMAIVSHVADRAERQAIYRRIFAPDDAAWRQIATPYYNYYVICALGDLGRTREALNFIRRYWGGMLREGATTFWEQYTRTPRPVPTAKPVHLPGVSSDGLPTGLKSYTNSLSHGWSAGVTSFLTEQVLGIRPTRGGFTTASIVPHLGGLKWARGRVPAPRGNIVLSVTKHGASESLHVTLPPGVKALVGVAGRSVTVDGHAVMPVRRSAKRCYIRLTRAGEFSIVGHN